MPQMMPINWLMLMLTFIIMILLLNIMNYFIFNNNFKLMNKIKKSSYNFNWKW
uniref:ATP synthase complex subunit 8 n=1 Tax=Kozhantshikovia vernalis TaxID=1765126 RepID=A0A8K1W7Z4_9NEOP|nr:ATP synthase F0 subunit 8 [Kozhantshikovia vernalis]